MIVQKTGLVPDPYFSASKIKWILDNVAGAREDAEAGKLAFGTVDSWLIWSLTFGAVHATDPTNASRTMLYNIHEMRWDPELLDLFGIPASMLPEVRPSSGDFGVTANPGVVAGAPVSRLNVDGGASANGFLMQFQSDILGCALRRPKNVETTALGAAYLAGLSSGFWNGVSDLAALRADDDVFAPQMDEARRAALMEGWRGAVRQVMTR